MEIIKIVKLSKKFNGIRTPNGPLTNGKLMSWTEMTATTLSEQNSIISSASQRIGHGFQRPLAFDGFQRPLAFVLNRSAVRTREMLIIQFPEEMSSMFLQN